MPAALIRKSLESLSSMKLGDPNKAIKKIWELAELPEPPLRLVLGKDALRYAREQQHVVKADFDKYESWSDDLQEA